ncbi:alpha-ribazole phosphatase [Cytobacillus eiseniae]|uniref:Alpha-ribazole phosphatase n=1 Tax=Cytobacillus eiseniae TaxID=762947 RepID=A0ABS4RHM6_9BACI|nr:histidine phosphatase family protein [Cytobacillus eiseniae]MBP2242412.1 alpha-ribazole phosphatase [Cytobacillus eiseniae]
MDDTVVLALFRHGLTEANKRHAYLGWTDSPLYFSEKMELALQGSYEHMFSSDLGRCLRTAEILFPNNDLEPISELREMHFGEWEGKTFDQLKEDPIYQKWLTSPFIVKPPNGESFAQFSRRVDSGWEKVVDRLLVGKIQKAAVISHGGVIRYLLTKYAPQMKDFWEWKVPHDTGYELIWHLDRLRRGERCTLLREVPLTENPDG